MTERRTARRYDLSLPVIIGYLPNAKTTPKKEKRATFRRVDCISSLSRTLRQLGVEHYADAPRRDYGTEVFVRALKSRPSGRRTDDGARV
jgi:hypothetical protein